MMLLAVSAAIACNADTANKTSIAFFCNPGAATLYNEDDLRAVPSTECGEVYNGTRAPLPGALVNVSGGLCACSYNEVSPDPLILERTQFIKCTADAPDTPLRNMSSLAASLAKLAPVTAPSCPVDRPRCVGFYSRTFVANERVLLPGVCQPSLPDAPDYDALDFLYPASDSRYSEREGVGPQACDCHSQRPEWSVRPAPASVLFRVLGTRDSDTCSPLRASYTWPTGATTLTMPAGEPTPVSVVNRTGTLVKVGNKSIPCGRTFHHPPSAITLKDYCSVPPLATIKDLITYNGSYDPEAAAVYYGKRLLKTTQIADTRVLAMRLISLELANNSTRALLASRPPHHHGSEGFPGYVDNMTADFHIGSPHFDLAVVDEHGFVSPFLLLFYHFGTAVFDYGALINRVADGLPLNLDALTQFSGSHFGKAPRFDSKFASGFEHRFLGDIPSLTNKLVLPGRSLSRSTFDCHLPAKERECAFYHSRTSVDANLARVCELNQNLTFMSVETACYLRVIARSAAPSEGRYLNISQAHHMTLMTLFDNTPAPPPTRISPYGNLLVPFADGNHDCEYSGCLDGSRPCGVWLSDPTDPCYYVPRGNQTWFDFILRLPVFGQPGDLDDHTCYLEMAGFLPRTAVHAYLSASATQQRAFDRMACAAIIDLVEQFYQIVKLALPSILTDTYKEALYADPVDALDSATPVFAADPDYNADMFAPTDAATWRQLCQPLVRPIAAIFDGDSGCTTNSYPKSDRPFDTADPAADPCAVLSMLPFGLTPSHGFAPQLVDQRISEAAAMAAWPHLHIPSFASEAACVAAIVSNTVAAIYFENVSMCAHPSIETVVFGAAPPHTLYSCGNQTNQTVDRLLPLCLSLPGFTRAHYDVPPATPLAPTTMADLAIRIDRTKAMYDTVRRALDGLPHPTNVPPDTPLPSRTNYLKALLSLFPNTSAATSTPKTASLAELVFVFKNASLLKDAPLKMMLFGLTPLVGFDPGCHHEHSPGMHGPDDVSVPTVNQSVLTDTHDYLPIKFFLNDPDAWPGLCHGRFTEPTNFLYVTDSVCPAQLSGEAPDDRLWTALHYIGTPDEHDNFLSASTPCDRRENQFTTGRKCIADYDLTFGNPTPGFQFLGKVNWFPFGRTLKTRFKGVRVNYAYTNFNRNCRCVPRNDRSKNVTNLWAEAVLALEQTGRSELNGTECPDDDALRKLVATEAAVTLMDPNLYVAAFGRENWVVQAQLGMSLGLNLYSALEHQPASTWCPDSDCKTPLRPHGKEFEPTKSFQTDGYLGWVGNVGDPDRINIDSFSAESKTIASWFKKITQIFAPLKTFIDIKNNGTFTPLRTQGYISSLFGSGIYKGAPVRVNDKTTVPAASARQTFFYTDDGTATPVGFFNASEHRFELETLLYSMNTGTSRCYAHYDYNLFQGDYTQGPMQTSGETRIAFCTMFGSGSTSTFTVDLLNQTSKTRNVKTPVVDWRTAPIGGRTRPVHFHYEDKDGAARHTADRKSYDELVPERALHTLIRLGHMAAGRAAPYAALSWLADEAAAPVLTCTEFGNGYRNYNSRVVPDFQHDDSHAGRPLKMAAALNNKYKCKPNGRCSPLNDNQILNTSSGIRWGRVPHMKRAFRGPLAWQVALEPAPDGAVTQALFTRQDVWQALEDYSTLRADSTVGLFSENKDHLLTFRPDVDWRPTMGERPPGIRFNRYQSLNGLRAATTSFQTANRIVATSPDSLTQCGGCLPRYTNANDDETPGLYRRRHFVTLDPSLPFSMVAPDKSVPGLLPRFTGTHAETEALRAGFAPDSAGLNRPGYRTLFFEEEIPDPPTPCEPRWLCGIEDFGESLFSFAKDFGTVGGLAFVATNIFFPEFGLLEFAAVGVTMVAVEQVGIALQDENCGFFDGRSVLHPYANLETTSLQRECSQQSSKSMVNRAREAATANDPLNFDYDDHDLPATPLQKERLVVWNRTYPPLVFTPEEQLLDDALRDLANTYATSDCNQLAPYTFRDAGNCEGFEHLADADACGAAARAFDLVDSAYVVQTLPDNSTSRADAFGCFAPFSGGVFFNPFGDKAYSGFTRQSLCGCTPPARSATFGIAGDRLFLTPHDRLINDLTVLEQNPDLRFESQQIFSLAGAPDGIPFFTAATHPFPSVLRVVTTAKTVERPELNNPYSDAPSYTAEGIAAFCARTPSPCLDNHRACIQTDAAGCVARDVPDCTSRPLQPCSDAEFPVCVNVKRTAPEGTPLRADGTRWAGVIDDDPVCIPIAHKKLLNAQTFESLFEEATLWRPNCPFAGSKLADCRAPPQDLTEVALNTSFARTSAWANLYKPFSYFSTTSAAPTTTTVGIPGPTTSSPEDVLAFRETDVGTLGDGYPVTTTIPLSGAPTCGLSGNDCAFLVDYLTHADCPRYGAGTWPGTCIKPALQTTTPAHFAAHGYLRDVFKPDPTPVDETCGVYEPELQIIGASAFKAFSPSITDARIRPPEPEYAEALTHVHYCDTSATKHIFCDNDALTAAERTALCASGGKLVYEGVMLTRLSFDDACDPATKTCFLLPGVPGLGTLAAVVSAIAALDDASGYTIKVLPFTYAAVKSLLLGALVYDVTTLNAVHPDYACGGGCGEHTFCTAAELAALGDKIILSQNLTAGGLNLARSLCSGTFDDAVLAAFDALRSATYYSVTDNVVSTDPVDFTPHLTEGGTLVIELPDLTIEPVADTINMTRLSLSVVAPGFTLKNAILHTELSPAITFSGSTAVGTTLTNVAASTAMLTAAFLGATTDYADYSPAIDVANVALTNVTGSYAAGFARAVGTVVIDAPMSTLTPPTLRCNTWASAYGTAHRFARDIEWSLVGNQFHGVSQAWNGTFSLSGEIVFANGALVNVKESKCVHIQDGVLVLASCPGTTFTASFHEEGNPFMCVAYDNGTFVHAPCSPCAVGRGRHVPCDELDSATAYTPPSLRCAGGLPCTKCGLAALPCTTDKPVGYEILGCVRDPHGAVFAYHGCPANATGVVAITSEGAVGALYDCGLGRVVVGGYGYRSNHTITTHRVVIQPETALSSFELADQTTEVINITAYTTIFGKAYEVALYHTGPSLAGVKAVVITVLAIVVAIEVVLHIGLTWSETTREHSLRKIAEARKAIFAEDDKEKDT